MADKTYPKDSTTFITVPLVHRAISVIDRHLTAPPGGAAEGDRYIVASVATGAWAGKERQIAEYHVRSGSAITWYFYDPNDGFIVYVQDEDAYYHYKHATTTWVVFVTTGDTGIGSQGDTGIQGDTGAASTVPGDTGTQGDTGTGTQGDTGIQGDTGVGEGTAGDTGIQGDTGAASTIPGDTGIQGDTGAASTIPGDTGITGDTGVGTQGDTGVGTQGDTGITGDTGAGTQGDTGIGTAGDTGVTGDTGSPGDTGTASTVPGDTGIQGDTGVAGDTGTPSTVPGDTGSQGDTGIQGDTGTEFVWRGAWGTSIYYDLNDCIENAGNGYVCAIAHTSDVWATDLAAGKWNLLVSQGDTGTTGDTGITGDTGSQGDTGAGLQGDTGAASTVAGDTGAQGDTGVTGQHGDTGAQGPDGDTGVAGATWSLTTAPADHGVSGIVATLTAHATVNVGDACYINASGEMAIGDADAIASSAIIGMATATISADNPGIFLLRGFIRDDSWNWTVGGFIYLTVTGTTGNTLSQTAPTGEDDCVVILGIATHADRMYFNPQLVITELTA